MTSPRLWWLITDVLPLAEHALAVPKHYLTGAQTCAGAATQPALVWTSDPAGDRLSSNGTPIWYDADGNQHQIPAPTWHHPATGTVGSPGQPDPAAGFLPLTHHGHTDTRGHRPPLIEILRRGRRTGAHWFVFDTTATNPADRYRVSDHRHDLAPTTAEWVPALVTSPAVEDRVYPAPIADGYTALGGAIPHFDLATVQAMAGYLLDRHHDTDPRTDLMPGELPLLRFDGPAVAVLWSYDDGQRERWVEIDRVHPDRDGLFPIGAYQWQWSVDPTG